MFLRIKKLNSSLIKFQVNPIRTMLSKSINHIMNKKIMDRYIRLPLPPNKIMATYVWIDGSGINMRSKDRILKKAPVSAAEAPDWSFDGSSTGQATTGNSDTSLKPVAVYKDPFRMEPHILVLCETYLGDGKPTKSNNRHFLVEQIRKYKDEDPWFGLEQEYTMQDVDGAGLGWPKAGFPAVRYEFSYCGVGAKYMAGRDICDAHAFACLYSGLDFEGTNAEVMFGCWEWQIGTTAGVKAADDLWMSRYIMARVAEDYGVHITYHPKPHGPMHPGIGMHHNFSTKSMRGDGGFKVIEAAMKKLEANHDKHMKHYGLGDGQSNRMRLTGTFETSSFDKFSWGVADREKSVRIQRSVKNKGKGFFEDRRPAGDCDPYLVCGLLMETCLGGGGDCCKPCKPQPCK